jgi:hypothetical protein
LDKKEKITKIIGIIMIVSLIIIGVNACIDSWDIPLRPSGTVLTSAYLSSLCTIKIISLSSSIIAFLGVTCPILILFIMCYRKLTVPLILAELLIATGLVFLFGIPDRFKEPYVVEKTVVSKESRYKICFSDDDKIRILRTDYKKLNEGDKVYVVYCDDTIVDVFPASDYSLPEYNFPINIK